MNEMNHFKKFARHLAEESSKVILPYFRKNVTIEVKDDLSPVTIADQKAEEIMREMIMNEFPDHGIIGEEFGIHKNKSDYTWVLDPIDGTKSFICGTVTFGTMIALLRHHKPILGIIYQPVLREYLVGDNETAMLNDVQVKIRNCNDLSEAVLLTTDHLNIKKYKDINKFNNLIEKVKLYRNWGDCYGYYLLATGYADIMIDPVMSIWDTAALVPIIKGAGGLITDYNGEDPMKSDNVIAASPGIHQQILDMLK
ncbi:MAG TPA: histidinol-phosphatase [Ignavibacteriaceae bacterium]|nr:histidinol-phosphatase [Ignavibacteriaceae bacterium]